MRIGIGLPAAVPGADAVSTGDWAAESEERGFRSLSVIDRLVYDNLDPLVALAAAAARTEHVELLTTVLNVGYRRNPVVLAKQIDSVERLSGGRLTVGLGMGGWPEDHAVSDVEMTRRGAAFEATLAAMHEVWRGEVTGASGPIPALPQGRPGVLLAGLVTAGFARAAALSDGWVAPSFGLDILKEGVEAVRREWARAGRRGRPRVIVERYFCLGTGAAETAEKYVAHYYGAESLPRIFPDVVTEEAHLREEIRRLAGAGADDLVLLPCSGESGQIGLLAEALDGMGWGSESSPE
ncbi:LLM class flavin-dependent oxidoreductase [Streptomyces bathyalis]|uniref:LLM class flavin-dependent oxidoreductase n=1 Tax=Streptomyces bathyalis TaxID=2710756 RepID=A0A7T1T2V3_9ACTN|nr:LLM class flavin-dependent oxidoreductase [Streptomyces bathyalis]QPP05359.1 LLM class flavin-dependent oxidoreductase [Streptomyces bathyalis]